MAAMESNNILRYKVLDALVMMSDALGPIVARMLSDNGFSRYEASGRISPVENLAITDDASQVLSAMLGHWREVFEPFFGHPNSQRVRSLVFQVRDVRNVYEGHPNGDYSYADEALVDIRRLLEAFSADEAARKVNGLKQELARLMLIDLSTLKSFGPQAAPAVDAEQAHRAAKAKMRSEAGRVEQAIRQHCANSDVLPTSGGRSSFKIISIEIDGLRILAGKSRLPLIPWGALEGVVPYLTGRDRVMVGGVRQSIGAPGTLDDYFKRMVTKTTVANYVAPILVESGVAEYVPEPGAKRIRLSANFMEG